MILLHLTVGRSIETYDAGIRILVMVVDCVRSFDGLTF